MVSYYIVLPFINLGEILDLGLLYKQPPVCLFQSIQRWQILSYLYNLWKRHQSFDRNSWNFSRSRKKIRNSTVFCHFWINSRCVSYQHPWRSMNRSGTPRICCHWRSWLRFYSTQMFLSCFQNCLADNVVQPAWPFHWRVEWHQ